MALNFLIGPVDDEFIAAHLADLRASDCCRTFGPGRAADVGNHPHETWDAFCAHLPSGWRPDFLCAWLPYTSVPNWVWSARIPVIGFAGDWNLLWHRYRYCLPRCDLVLCDAAGTEAIERAGLAPVQPAILYGATSLDLNIDADATPRDIDILFVGNLHAPAQGERLPWLARIARWSERFHVVVRAGVFDDDYRALLSRAKIVFNRSVRGEVNLRASEALSAGALLFQEADNRELPTRLAPNHDYVAYSFDDLDSKLEHYLTHDEDRNAIAAAGRVKVATFAFSRLWADALDKIEGQWPHLLQRAAQRVSTWDPPGWLERTWQWQIAVDRSADPNLPAEIAALYAAGSLDDDGLYASAVLTPETLKSADRFRTLLDRRPDDVLAGLGRAEALTLAGQKAEAIKAAGAALDRFNHAANTEQPWLNVPLYPPGMHRFRAEWERAGWAHAGDPGGETLAKRDLFRWRFNALLAELTGEIGYYHEAALARPDLPEARAALGCALARNGQVSAGLPHLRSAVALQPFDLAAARGLGQALLDAGATAEREQLQTDRRRLNAAAPQAVLIESWFAAPSPAAAVDATSPGLVWEGDFRGLHSIALVNRAFASALARRGGVTLSAWPIPISAPNVTRLAPCPELRNCLHRRLPQTAVHVRHQWPPRWDEPPAGRWVLIQPWEYGSLPKDWLKPILNSVDDVWVHTRHVRDTYLDAGVPEERVHLVPLGVDPSRFRPDAPPLDVPGAGTFRFLFVGGAIWRKGVDLLVEAFTREFHRDEPVTLLVKRVCHESYYKGQTADALLDNRRSEGVRIEFVDGDFSDAELPGLYTACDCLAHPYRAEGFGLPVAEAMACGKPVIVTKGGACLDFCDPETAFLVDAQKTPVPKPQAASLRVLGTPWVYEPDIDALRVALRSVVTDPTAARAKGLAASQRIRRDWTWDHSAAAVENRVRELAARGPERRWNRTTPATAKVSLCMIVKNEERNLPDCLAGLSGYFHEIVIADTGSTDRTQEIAKSFGARIVEFPWIDDFAAARNASLMSATGDWIMWLDADDRLDDTNRARLKELFARLGSENFAYVMKCACTLGGSGSSQTIVDHVRLFRNDPRLRWTYRVHEQILPAIRKASGGVRWSDVVIHHVGYADPALRRTKLDRDLRLLHLDNASKPDDPFTLFNLGTVYQEIDKAAEAIPLLRRSLDRSQPGDSIVRKAYALMANCHRKLDQPTEALAVCREGRGHYPDDAELLFVEGLLQRERRDDASAEACWLRLLNQREANHFGSVDSGLSGPKTRHNLGVLYFDQGRYADAERQWRSALDADAAYTPAKIGLSEIYLKQHRWAELGRSLTELADAAPLDGALLRSRMQIECLEFAAARQTLAAAIERHPAELRLRVVASHAWLKEGKDWPAAEKALLDVLTVDPNHAEAHRNLHLLRSRHKPAGSLVI